MKELLEQYKKKLREFYNNPDFMGSFGHNEYEHVMWMLDEIAKFTDVGKQNRWLGFVHGFFWSFGIYTIDEMREHVRQLPV